MKYTKFFTVAFLVALLVLVAVLLFKNDKGSVISEMPEMSYYLHILDKSYLVEVIEEPLVNSLSVRTTFQCRLTSGSDMWIPATVSSIPGPQTGFQILFYDEKKSPIQFHPYDVKISVESDGERTSQGIHISPGKITNFRITILNNQNQSGLVGVRIAGVWVHFADIRFPEGIFLKVEEGEIGFDTGLRDHWRKPVFRTPEVFPGFSTEKGKKA